MVCKKVETSLTAAIDVEKAASKRRKRRSRVRRGASKRVRSVSTSATVAVAATVAETADAAEKPMKELSTCGVHSFFLKHQSALRRIPAKLPPKVTCIKRLKRVSWKDEEGGGGGGCGGGDPAVLAMGPVRRVLQYSRERLLALRNTPLARAQPDIKHDAFTNIRKRTESPKEEDRAGRGDTSGENHKGGSSLVRGERRSADPRERVRKESEPSAGGIVLSPQRRSFTSGCQAPGAPAAPAPHLSRTRPESPLGAAAKPEPVRRIGSGRIAHLRADLTQPPWERATAETPSGKEEPEPERTEQQQQRAYNAQPYRPPPAVARDRGDDRFERRSFGRDTFGSDMKRDREDRFSDKRDRDDRRMGNSRYGNQRRFEKEIAEPEWYSGGPTSQLETIELRGFDEPVRDKPSGNNKDSEKWSNGGRSPPPANNDRWKNPPSSSPPPARSTPTPRPPDKSSDEKEASETEAPQQPARREEPPTDDDFNLDEFLKFDNLPDLLTNGSNDSESTTGSRFSRWFQRSADTPNDHHDHLFNNMMDDFESGGSEPAHMFAPISPAGAPNAAPPSLLEMLQRANAAQGSVHPHPQEMNAGGGKIHSLEELEARMMGARPAPHHHHAPHPHTAPPHHAPDMHASTQDTLAFKRLLAQVSGNHPGPASAEPPQHKPQPMSLLQMLNKSMNAEQQQKQKQQQAPQIPQDVLYKLLQVQQRQQQQQEIASDRELLQRTEAQAILHGLRHGDLTPQHLMQQLGNPNLQSRHREMLASILRHTSPNTHARHHPHQMGGSPLPGAGPPHLAVPPHHQPLRLSPLPPLHGGVPQPLSPRELAAHTQSIMQHALIKKKLEEQTENYRRRFEPKQATPIAFTPTSVLRKMTADKEDPPSGAKLTQQQWSQMQQKIPQGRPIVKGNQTAAGPPLSAFGQPEFPHQHYLNHPQIPASRQYPHHQQRQTPSQVDNLYMNNRGGGSNTLQQFFQSQQRGINDMRGMLGGDSTQNQLERWFGPELLAQAQAGKLPSVHVPNALSLEELERNHQATVRN